MDDSNCVIAKWIVVAANLECSGRISLRIESLDLLS